MNNNPDEQLVKAFDAVNQVSENRSLNLGYEEKENLEDLKTELTGAISSLWLPIGTTRKKVMLLFFLVGLYGIINVSLWFLIFWIMLPLFSPRIMSLITRTLGRLLGHK